MNKNKNSSKSPQRSNIQNITTSKKRRRNKKSKNNHRDRDDINHSAINSNKNISKSTSNSKSNGSNNNAPKLSYAARISSASSKPSKKSSLRIRSASAARAYESISSPRQSLHGNRSREELLRIRMQQRDICYVAGLPKTICTRAILGSKKWFGQFGKIRDITITDNQNCIRTNWMCVHIKYFENISALRAVQAMNHKKLDDGRVLEANYGTQRYCEFFINNKKCHKSNCPFRHSWCKLNEIVNFNNHHQIISNQNQNQSQRISIATTPKQQQGLQPQTQQMQAQTSTSPQPQSIRPQAIISQQSQQSTSDNAVHSVASTSSADLKQNDINIGSDKNDENMISINADYVISDNNDENEEAQLQQEEPGASQQEDIGEDMNDEHHELQIHQVHNNNNNMIEHNLTNNILREQEMEMHELYQELQCIKEENKTQTLQLMEFQRQIAAKDAEIVKLQKISRRLYDAHSRLKTENDALQKQNTELIQEINKSATQSLDLLDYTLWTWHDVYHWIISIENGKYQKYKDVLEVNLKLENIDGSCIKCLSTNDIHRIGIIDYKDKQLILECIANLKSNLGLDNLINDIINTDTHCINVNVNTNHPPHIV